MTLDNSDMVDVVGRDGATHRVPVWLSEHLFDGRTGEPITDEQYDEMKARFQKHGAWPFDPKEGS